MCELNSEITQEDIVRGHGEMTPDTTSFHSYKYFVIKPLQSSPTYEKDITTVNEIYKIEEDNIIVENKSKGHKNVSIKIETREILNHINKTNHAFKSFKQDIHIPQHFEKFSSF